MYDPTPTTTTTPTTPSSNNNNNNNNNNNSNSNSSSNPPPSGTTNIKDLFPAHSRKIDILEQRIFGASTSIPPPTTTTTTSPPHPHPNPPHPQQPHHPPRNALTSSGGMMMLNTHHNGNLSNEASTDDEKAEEEILLDSDEDVEQNNNSKSAVMEEDPHPKQTGKRGRFNQQEDMKIIEGYNKFGNKWDEIIRWGNLERTPSQVSSRFTRKLCKNTSSSSSSSSFSSSSSSLLQRPAISGGSVTRNVSAADDISGKKTVDGEPPTKQRRIDSTGRLEPLTTFPSSASTTITTSYPSTTATTTVTPAINGFDPHQSSTASTSTTTSTILTPPRDTTTATTATTTMETRKLAEQGELRDSEHWKGLQSERDRLGVLEQGLRELEGKLRDWEDSLKEREFKLREERESKLREEQGRVAEIVKNQLVMRTQAERTLARKKLAEDCIRLGQASFERRGLELHEIWQDGELFRHLDEQIRATAARREQLEGTKKQLAKKRQSGGAASSSSSSDSFTGAGGGMEPLSAAGDTEEICKVRIMAYKREETALQEERERLNGLKMLHMKELKRVMDEDQSRFNTFPVLRDGRYVLLSLLGKGGFSEVYHGFDLKELREVACKIHSVNTMWSTTKRQNYTKHAVREYMIHKELVHPRVVRLYDVFEIDTNSFCTVLEYCEGGDLDSYLKQNKVLSEREAKCIISQIFSGLKYLNTQKRPIIHYDLKPGNILFSTTGEVKITDFGLSKIVEEDAESVELTSQGAGTYWYLPPECFEMGGKTPPKISSKVDVWSAGVIFYQMLYGRKPFGNDMSQQKFLTENVSALTSRLEFPSKPIVSKEAKDFLSKCLTHRQDLRPDMQTICADSFFLNSSRSSSSTASNGKKSTSASPSIPSISPSTMAMPPPTKATNPKRKIDSSFETQPQLQQQPLLSLVQSPLHSPPPTAKY